MSGVAGISPRTWGLLLFAFEMYILFRAFIQGRGRALWLLIPTFVLWANLDQTFLTGLLVLAAATIGCLLDARNVTRPAARKEKPDGKAAGSSSARPRPNRLRRGRRPRSLSSWSARRHAW